MTLFEWQMECNVNNEHFVFNGNGKGDPAVGTLNVEFEASRFPAGFDPVSCPMICNSPASIGFACADRDVQGLLELAEGELSVEPARAGSVYDSRGKQLLGLSISSVVVLKGDRIVVGNRMEGFSHLPALMKNITPVQEYIVPNGPGSAISSISFKLQARDGEILTGLTIVPYRWRGDRVLSAPLVRRYEAVDVHWDGGTRVNTMIRSYLSKLMARDEVDLHIAQGAQFSHTSC